MVASVFLGDVRVYEVP